MSTRSSIAHANDWHLFEEMIDDTVWIETNGHPFQCLNDRAEIRLPPDAIDAIRKAPANRFPHLRAKGCPQGFTIPLPRDLAEHAAEYMADLIGDWEWKRGERAGNGEQYDALVECRRRMVEALGQADGKEVEE